VTRILAPTTKVGYYAYTRTSSVDDYFADGSFRRTQNYSYTSAISYKAPTVGSDKHKPTAYSRVIIRSVGEPFDIRYILSGGRSKSSNSFGSWLRMSSTPWGQLSLNTGSVSPSAYLRTNAIAAAVAKLHGQQAFIMEDLAQSAKAARQAYDIFKLIVSKTGGYLATLYEILAFYDSNWNSWSRKRGGPSRIRKDSEPLLRRLANAWLAWYYGIKPLISTMKAIGDSRKPRFKTITAKAKFSGPLNPSGLFSQADVATLNYSYTGECKEETTCKLICDVVMSDTVELLNRLGFRGGGNPFEEGEGYDTVIRDGEVLLLGWALLPYSFIFDWIVPVEKFLSTLTWSPGITYQGGYITDWMGGNVTCRTRNGAYGYTGSMPSGRVEAILFQRESYNNYPPPAALAVNQSISPVNRLNAAALLLQIHR